MTIFMRSLHDTYKMKA